MAGSFDPYEAWLGIGPQDRPITFYRLLGLAPGNCTAAQVQQAYETRLARIQPHLNDARASLARRTITELDAAKQCLADPAKKARYDAKLGLAPRSPAGPAVQAAPAAPATEGYAAVAEPADDDDSGPAWVVPTIVGVGVGGFLILGLVAWFMMSPGAKPGPSPVVAQAPPQGTPPAPQTPAPAEVPKGSAEPPAKTSDPVVPAKKEAPVEEPPPPVDTPETRAAAYAPPLIEVPPLALKRREPFQPEFENSAQRRVAEMVRRHKGSLRLAGSSQLIRASDPLPDSPPLIEGIWLDSPEITTRELQDLHFINTLQEVTITKAYRVGVDEHLPLEWARKLTGLERFVLHDSDIDDEDVTSLNELKGLRHLALSSPRLRDQVPRSMPDGIVFLELRGRFSDALFKNVFAVKNLATLSVASHSIYGKDANALSLPHGLSMIYVHGTGWGDPGCNQLNFAPNVTHVWLRAPLVTDVGMGYLCRMMHLKALVVESERVTDKGLESLGQNHKLKILGLHGARITGESLTKVRKLYDLETLNLSGCLAIDDTGLAHLAGHEVLKNLVLSGTNVTDAGVPTIATMPALKSVVLDSTRITKEGAAQLDKVNVIGAGKGTPPAAAPAPGK